MIMFGNSASTISQNIDDGAIIFIACLPSLSASRAFS
jgi:hypothetical protein